MAGPRWFVCRHGETVFNAAGRMQGDSPHTPLTRAGFAQAEAMGETLRHRLGPSPALTLWSSPAGRALQTLAVVAEHLDIDWHSVRVDPRLSEIDVGGWSGRYYRDVEAEVGRILDRRTALFTVPPPEGEWYDEVAARLEQWIEETAAETGDRLIVMHGMSSRVLRGLLSGAAVGECGAPMAASLPQGSVVEVAGGIETILSLGEGGVD